MDHAPDDVDSATERDDTTDDGPDHALSRAAAVARLVALTVTLVVVGVVSVNSGIDLDTIRGLVESAGWIGPVAYVAAYAVLTVALVPGAVLTAAGGLLFGVALGSALSVVGATLGAVVAFAVARTVGRTAVDRLVSGRVATVDRWIGERGLLAVLTLRLVPLVPFSVANYAAGVTAVRTRDYLIGTAVGIIPGTVAYTVLGARATDPTDPVFLVAIATLVVLGVGGALWLRRARGHRSDD